MVTSFDDFAYFYTNIHKMAQDARSQKPANRLIMNSSNRNNIKIIIAEDIKPNLSQEHNKPGLQIYQFYIKK